MWKQNFNGFKNLKPTIFKVTRLRKINILADFKWNYGLCGHVLTWQQIQVFCISNISKTEQTSARKHAEHCLTHPNKTACEIWSVFGKVYFWVKYLTPLVHRILQFVLILVFIDSNKKVVYCWNWSKEDMSAAASREVPMTKQIIDCLSALGEA